MNQQQHHQVDQTRVAEIRDRFGRARDRVEKACARTGRDPGEVTIVAVTKRHAPVVIASAHAAGIDHVGENYAQEMRDKLAELGPLGSQLTWHFVGRLQRNKVKYVAGHAGLIHAVDSASLAREIARRAAKMQLTQRVLIAVNVGGEEQKGGVSPEDAGALLATIAELDGIEPAGLMTMPPLAASPEDNRGHFRALVALRDRLRTPDRPLAELSMGTTDDFEVAVEEGATLVRIGTAIFGPRPAG
ncbi:MAG: YggS family pyridoxal phosphate-dependent enzyme [Proteobacteria bacterium]|nr:YggS family pyridoxal phosphate-dependent enzyme [Pseudomonadota bacterium]